MKRFILTIAFSIFLALSGVNAMKNQVTNLALRYGAHGMLNGASTMLNLTYIEQVTSGLNDFWMVIWMSVLNSQLYQNPQGALYTALVYMAMTATKEVSAAWISASAQGSTSFNDKFLASVRALRNMGWFAIFSFISVAAYSFLYFVNPFLGFTMPLALGNILTGIMVVASMFVNVITYTFGWLENRKHTNLGNNIIPINWFYMFAFSAYALGTLYMSNAVSWHNIENSLYYYGALSVGNQLVVKLPSNPETRKKVRNFVNKCYQKIVNVGVFLLPLVPAAIGAINNYILSDTGEY